MRSIDLSGQVALILGVANQRSLAWAIAEALGEAGASLVFTYQGERLKERVGKLLDGKFPDSPLVECDVTDPAHVTRLFETVNERHGKLDTLIHSVAFAPKEALEGDFLETRLSDWRVATEISAYSLIELCREAKPLMGAGASVLAMTYMASQRVVPNYNVMGSAKAALEHCVRQLAYELGSDGIRVNAISAGPVQTVSARGISGFNSMIGHHRERAPLGRSIEPREVGDTALFLSSPMGSGITGEILYVDAGYNIMG